MTPGPAELSTPRTGRRPADVADWLRTGPSLEEMRELYPREWQRVDAEMATLVERSDAEELREFLTTLQQPRARPSGRLPPRKELIAETIRQQMALRAVTQALLSAEAGIQGNEIRLGRFNRRVIEKLILTTNSRRKAVSLVVFRLVWPFLTQRRRLLPMVFEQGIYCFYSHSLLRGLDRLIAGRSCLEIAAGDGTLARLLHARGVQVTATDDHSWHQTVSYGADVTKMDARAALRKHEPEVVVCSWPPAGNTFENAVFSTPSVHTYILITARKKSAAGNWQTYAEQNAFDVTLDKQLSRCVLPPGVGSVYVFTRKPDPALHG